MEQRSSVGVAHPRSQTPFALKIVLFQPKTSKNKSVGTRGQSGLRIVVLLKRFFFVFFPPNLRSRWLSNLGFHYEPVLFGGNVTDAFDSSFYSDPLWIFVHCCQGEEWSSRDTQFNMSAQHHNTDRITQLPIPQDGCENYSTALL